MDVLDFLKLNDYIVYVRPVGKNAVTVSLPENKELDMAPTKCTYFYYKNEIIIDYKSTQTYTVKEYEGRPFITAHICLLSMERNIPPKYILIVNNEGKKTRIMDLFNEQKITKNETELVKELSEMMIKGQYNINSKHHKSLEYFISIFSGRNN